MKKGLFTFLFLTAVLSFVSAYTYDSLDALRKDIKTYGKDPVIYTNAGIYYVLEAIEEKDLNRKKNLVVQAKKYLEQAIELDSANSKARSFLGITYGLFCQVETELSVIMDYNEKCQQFLNDAVSDAPYLIDVRINRVRSFIMIPFEVIELNKVLESDLAILLNSIEKDMEYRVSPYYYGEIRSELYYIRGLLRKRQGKFKESKEDFAKAETLLKEHGLSINYEELYEDFSIEQ